MKEKIAIIGGSGFVGRSLLQILKKDNSVLFTNFDKNVNQENAIYIDVTNRSSLDVLRGFDTIINLAAEHRDDVRPISLYDEVNVNGAKNICSAATEYGIKKIIFTSSVAVYGFAMPNVNESGPINYFNHYGRTKFEAEKVYSSWLEKNPEEKSLVIIRPTVIFGKGNRGNVFNLFDQIHSKKFFMIGDGKNIKSMAYVENVADFISFSLSFKSGKQLFNYVDKPDMDMNELVRTVRKKLFNKEDIGLRIPVLLGYMAGYFFDFLSYVFRFKFPISKIRIQKFISNTQFNSKVADTGFLPKKSLKTALNETLDFEFPPKIIKNKNTNL